MVGLVVTVVTGVFSAFESGAGGDVMGETGDIKGMTTSSSEKFSASAQIEKAGSFVPTDDVSRSEINVFNMVTLSSFFQLLSVPDYFPCSPILFHSPS